MSEEDLRKIIKDHFKIKDGNLSINIKDKIINHYVSRFILIPKLDKYLDIRNCATRKNIMY